ncbi:unnamed protein product, partial [Dovyalis caffra]
MCEIANEIIDTLIDSNLYSVVELVEEFVEHGKDIDRVSKQYGLVLLERDNLDSTSHRIFQYTRSVVMKHGLG